MPKSSGRSEATGTVAAHRSPGGRGAGLTRAQIIDAAIALMDEEGVDAMTVRGLAGRLGVRSPALYWHFHGKDDICAAVVAEISDQVAITPLDGPPLDALARHVDAIREHWLAHPSALELSRRFPPTVTNDVVRAGIDLVRRLGVPAEHAVDRYRALAWSVMGFVSIEQSLVRSVHHEPADPEGRRWVVSVPGSAPSDLDTDQVFRTMVGLLLAGLVAEVGEGT